MHIQNFALKPCSIDAVLAIRKQFLVLGSELATLLRLSERDNIMQYFNENSICLLDPGLIIMHASYKGDCSAHYQTFFFFGASSIPESIIIQPGLFYTFNVWGVL